MSFVSFLAVFAAFLACATGLQVDTSSANDGQMSANTAGEDGAADVDAGSAQHNATSVLSEEDKDDVKHVDDDDGKDVDDDDDVDDENDDDDDKDDDLSQDTNKLLEESDKVEKAASSVVNLAAQKAREDSSSSG